MYIYSHGDEVKLGVKSHFDFLCITHINISLLFCCICSGTKATV